MIRTNKPEPISLSWGYPDLKNFPVKEFVEICQGLKIKDPQSYLQYEPTLGFKKFREFIAKNQIGNFGKISSENVLITSGATFSIFLVAFFFRYILGYKNIGVIEPCYDTSLEIFKILNFKIIDLNPYISGKAKRPIINCLYLMPRFSNPTGQVLTGESRSKIEKLISQNKVYAIEDDVYHHLNYSYKSKQFNKYIKPSSL